MLKDGKSQYTPEELQAKLVEMTGPHVLLKCGRHHYVAGSRMAPVKGCPDCWKVYYLNMFKNFTPGQRLEKLDKLEAVIHHWTEALDRGENPFTVFDRPTIEIEKDAE